MCLSIQTITEYCTLHSIHRGACRERCKTGQVRGGCDFIAGIQAAPSLSNAAVISCVMVAWSNMHLRLSGCFGLKMNVNVFGAGDATILILVVLSHNNILNGMNYLVIRVGRLAQLVRA